MIEFQDRVIPADMIGLDEPSEDVDVIIPADHSLAPHLRILINGNKNAESLVGMVNLSARYLFRYVLSNKCQSRAGTSGFSRDMLLMDQNGHPEFEKVDFESVVIAIAPTVGLAHIPKPWLPWVAHPSLKPIEQTRVMPAVMPTFCGDGDDEDDEEGDENPSAYNNPLGRPANSLRDLQRLLEEGRRRPSTPPPGDHFPMRSRLDHTANQQHIANQQYIARSNDQADALGMAVAAAQMLGGGSVGGMMGGLLGGGVGRALGDGQARLRSQGPTGMQGPVGSVGEPGPIGPQGPPGEHPSLAPIHQILIRARQMGQSGGRQNRSQLQIPSVMRTLEQLEVDLRDRNDQYNEAEPYQAERLREITQEISSMRQIWNRESSFITGSSGSSSGSSDTMSDSSSGSSSEEQEPARQFGAVDFAIQAGDLVRGPNNVPIGVVVGQSFDHPAGGFPTQHVHIRTDHSEFRVASTEVNRNGDGLSLELAESVGREIEAMGLMRAFSGGHAASRQLGEAFAMSIRPLPSRRTYVVGDQVDWGLINLQIFNTLSEVWLHLDTWHNCLTPVNSIRCFGAIGDGMNRLAGNLTMRNWTEICRGSVAVLGRFSTYVRMMMEDLHNAVRDDMECPCCTPEAFSFREGLFEAIISSGISIPECRTALYSYLYSEFVNAENRTSGGSRNGNVFGAAHQMADH